MEVTETLGKIQAVQRLPLKEGVLGGFVGQGEVSL